MGKEFALKTFCGWKVSFQQEFEDLSELCSVASWVRLEVTILLPQVYSMSLG